VKEISKTARLDNTLLLVASGKEGERPNSLLPDFINSYVKKKVNESFTVLVLYK
jgi:hypothetical protein